MQNVIDTRTRLLSARGRSVCDEPSERGSVLLLVSAYQLMQAQTQSKSMSFNSLHKELSYW